MTADVVNDADAGATGADPEVGVNVPRTARGTVSLKAYAASGRPGRSPRLPAALILRTIVLQ